MAETFQQWYDKLGGANKKLPRAKLRAAYNRRRAQLPRELIGDPNVVGRYRLPADKIRLNPNDVRFVTNPYGTTFAVKRTELDDLDPAARGEVKRFDEQSANQAARIQQAYDALAAQARADRDQGTAQLGELGRLTTSGLNLPAPREGTSQAEQALSGQLGQAAAERTVAENTMSVSRLNRLPTVIGSEGLSAAEGFRAERMGQRTELLSAIRQQRAEAAAASQEIAAELRGQNLSLLGKQMGNQTSIARAQLSSGDRAADRASRENIAAATLQERADRAREAGNLKYAIHLENLAAKKRDKAAKRKNKPLTAAQARTWSTRARKELLGDKNTPPRDGVAIIKDMVATGVPIWQALKITWAAEDDSATPQEAHRFLLKHFRGLTDRERRVIVRRATGGSLPKGHGAV